MLYVKKLQKKNIIGKNVPIMKIIFIVLITFLNFYTVFYPEYVTKKIVSNYKRIGGFTEKAWIDRKNTTDHLKKLHGDI